MDTFDLEQFAARTRAMAEQMVQMQSRLESMTTTGEAGDGLVSIRLGNNGRVSGVSIDPSLLDPAKRELLESLVAEAFGRAVTAMQQAAAEQMRPMTDQLHTVTDMGRAGADRF